MAITLGTPTSSGNQANSSTFLFSHTTSANTKCLVVVITGYDSSATDSVVNSVTFASVNLSQIAGGRYRVGSAFTSIWYLPSPFITTGDVNITMAGTCTDVQATAVGLIDASADSIIYDSFDTGTGTGSATGTVSPAKTGSMAIGGGVAVGGAPASLSVSTGTEISGSEADMGSQTASVGYAAESGGTATIAWTYSAVVCSCLVATFYSQFSPVVTLSSPTDGGSTSDTTPDLVFNGTDSNGDTIRYKVEIASGTPIYGSTNEQNIDTSGTSGNETLYSGATIEGGQVFTATRTGNITSVTFIMSKFGSPTGNAYARLYAITGTVGSTAVPTGSLLADSDALDVSTLSTTEGPVTFTFSGGNQYSMTSGTSYGIHVRYSAGSSANNVKIKRYFGQSFYGNAYSFSLSYTAISTLDYYFIVYDNMNNTLYTKISGTDAGFSGTPDNTDPFTSGQDVTYTVQAGDALAVGTYYWRVAGLDTNGLNKYGSYSSTYSFIITSGTPTNILQMCIET
jgi:hypothetical protein